MNFRTEAELKTFTDKNCPPLLYMYKAADGSVAQPTQGTTSQTATNDHSTTNNQEVNVDEADIIKTDGSYIYSVSGNVLSVIRAYPYNTTKVMSTLSFTATPASLFIEGNYLAVFGTDYE
jgi:inhibitor of cysteine peptidase